MGYFVVTPFLQYVASGLFICLNSSLGKLDPARASLYYTGAVKAEELQEPGSRGLFYPWTKAFTERRSRWLPPT
jgi:hypothetical protein